jgi:hypothetical protein
MFCTKLRQNIYVYKKVKLNSPCQNVRKLLQSLLKYLSLYNRFILHRNENLSVVDSYLILTKKTARNLSGVEVLRLVLYSCFKTTYKSNEIRNSLKK